MSEPLAERLSRFTPDGAGLDRDALLFAAGRASARPSRRWQALAGLLAASQLLSLVLLWPRTPLPSAPVAGYEPFAIAPPSPSSPRDPSELLVLRDRLLSAEGDLPASVSVEPLVPDDPPLRAFGAALPN